LCVIALSEKNDDGDDDLQNICAVEVDKKLIEKTQTIKPSKQTHYICKSS